MYASELAAYERACKFLKLNGRGYGLEGEKAADLNDAGKEMLLEVAKRVVVWGLDISAFAVLAPSSYQND